MSKSSLKRNMIKNQYSNRNKLERIRQEIDLYLEHNYKDVLSKFKNFFNGK